MERACYDAGRASSGSLRRWIFPRLMPIAVGDLAWAFDLARMEWVLRPVVETYEFDHVGDFVALTIDEQTIESTYHHPYWVVSGLDLEDRPRPDHVRIATPEHSQLPGRWVDAGDMLLGDVVLLMDGRQVPIQAIALRSVVEKVYNLQVQDLHNYAVGELRVLAHNMCAQANAPAKGIGEPVLFGQRRVSPSFSVDDAFPKTSGRSLADVVADLRKGDLTPDDLPLTAFRHPDTGALVSMNTRTRAVLAEAGLEPTRVSIVDLASLSARQQQKYLRRLGEDLIIDSPLPGGRVPVTPSMNDLRIMSRPDGSPYIISIPGFGR
ncbi:MAG: HINT domain-containing protein [Planctomycetia bacterium]|nr:HINT domain-containing protein [Planctomycetia bacterium]